MPRINPFDHNYFIGYISQVLPQYVKVHFPSSVLLNGFTHYGQELNGGLVGNFILIEGDKYGFLGRIVELALPESERLSLNERAFQTNDFHPTGKIEILLSFDLFEPLSVKRGLTAYPNIGAKVFVATHELVQNYLSRFGSKSSRVDRSYVTIGRLVSNPSTIVSTSMQSLFNRHCAVVGTTGGGKSYTVSKLIESLISTGNKAILIDATGEYDGHYDDMTNINIGDGKHVYHYSQLTVDDLLYLLRPSAKSQLPKLMEAIRSLKMVRINGGNSFQAGDLTTSVSDGVVKKENAEKRPYNAFYYKNINAIEDGYCTFDIANLAQQISEECVQDTNFSAPTRWAARNQSDLGFCITLISRVNNLLLTSEFKQVFGFGESINEDDLCKAIASFIVDPNKRLLRLNFQNVKFDFQVREILANAIGKYLLNSARKNIFKDNPIVYLVDEAHQFLSKSVKDEFFDIKPLDAFESIAKECRKQGLFLCMATQMPRDIPQGTLSQIGTFIVHRLINYSDKEAVSNACSSASKNTLDFLPVLGEGEAILTGIDFPMPIVMKFDLPNSEPNSQTPSLY